ncbi:HTH-type transcriptional regulator DmlR [Photorhabdus australis subsp. thailandensis]|uniref:HTH-type transcriptional regulator DmlR n=1 Tax=Photorhabdus australis subsp. thailandensis TaxID=2805096 RepID=A0A1C0U5P9_9GAMM|nr:LysR family transcriptional regulator [Photorhabdus australis]OCQ53254.1 HTH-type transcriptional regulator DmlR [Photorhabdus australis subsp. thailandensis]
MSTNKLLSLMSEMAVFVKVVDAGSFTSAARQLGATPSAVSRSITRLEKALGVSLLQRTTRKVKLCESKREIYEKCCEMFNAAQAVMNTSASASEIPQGLIRISIPKAVGHFIIHPHIPEFLNRYPKVDVQLLLEDRIIDLIDDQIDLAIRITDWPPSGLMGRRLMNINHMICATPEYLKMHGTPIRPNDLKNHNCIYLGEDQNDSLWRFHKNNKIEKIKVYGRYSANHTEVRLDAILRNIGIGSLPYFIARHSLEEGRIVQVLSDWTFKTNYCGDAWILYTPTRFLPAKIRVFIEYLTNKFNNNKYYIS